MQISVKMALFGTILVLISPQKDNFQEKLPSATFTAKFQEKFPKIFTQNII